MIERLLNGVVDAVVLYCSLLIGPPSHSQLVHMVLHLVGYRSLGISRIVAHNYMLRTVVQLLCVRYRPVNGFISQVLPDAQVAQTVAGPLGSLFSLFAGFLISPANIPDGWLFAHYLSPLHYVLEVGQNTTYLLLSAIASSRI